MRQEPKLKIVALASYRLSKRAQTDLIAIFEDSESRFGAYQAEAYLAGLERIFGLLADFPKIGQDASELKSGYRRFRFQTHVIFYSDKDKGILINAIVHAARDIRQALFD